MENEKTITKFVEKSIENQKYPKTVINEANEFCKHCNYNTKEMTLDKFASFVYDEKVLFHDAYLLKRIIKSVLNYADSETVNEWTTKNTATEILGFCDLEAEKKRLISKEEWENFRNNIEKIIIILDNDYIYKVYFVMILVWNGIVGQEYKKIKKEDIHIYQRNIEIKIDKKTYQISNDLNAIKIYNKIISNTDKNELFEHVRFFNERYKKKLGDLDQKVLNINPKELHTSGIIYRKSIGIEPEVKKTNWYLKDYYEAMANYMYKKE